MRRKFLGIDVGGTNLRAKIISYEGEVIAEKKTRSYAHLGIDRLIESLAGLIKEFSHENISAIGVGVPGIVDRKNGILVQAPNISNAKDFPFIETLSQKIENASPIFVENDASCAALGEYRSGAGKGSRSMIMITLGTGFGGGIILDGELWSGEDGFAGEFGHITINVSGPECACGSNGCVETYVSQTALRRIVRNRLGLFERLAVAEESDIPERLAKLAREKDEDAIAIWNDLGAYLGVSISILVNALNIKTVVVGGGLSNAWDLFSGKALDEAAKRTLGGHIGGLEIKKSTLGDDSGVFGACYLAREKLSETS